MADIISLDERRTILEQKIKQQEITSLEDRFLDEFEKGDDFQMFCTAFLLRELNPQNVCGLIGYTYERYESSDKQNAMAAFGRALTLADSTYAKNCVLIYAYFDLMIKDPVLCLNYNSHIFNEEKTKELSLIALANFSDEEELMELVQAVKDPWEENREYANQKLKAALSEAASACEDIFGSSQKKEKTKLRIVRDE